MGMIKKIRINFDLFSLRFDMVNDVYEASTLTFVDDEGCQARALLGVWYSPDMVFVLDLLFVHIVYKTER